MPPTRKNRTLSTSFLTNNICSFTVLGKQHLLKKGVNALVSVFFKRDLYYKNFFIYIKGLQKTLQFVAKQTKFIYVLFIDENIANDSKIMQIIRRCHNCVPVLFTCVKYIKGNYHIDLFGTMVRFFPMFNFPNNPFGTIICIDIELHDEDFVRLKSEMKHTFKGVTGAGDIERYLYKSLPPYIYAGMLCFNHEKIDSTILTNYIKDAEDGKIISKGYYGKRKTEFGHGIDEMFLNDVLFPYIGAVNVLIDYQISYFLYLSTPFIKKHVKMSSDILDQILGSYSKPSMTIDEKLNFIDKHTYQIHEKTPINNELSKNFMQVIRECVASKREWMETDVQLFLHKYIKHIISANLLIHYNYKHGIIGVDAYEAVYNSEHHST